MLRGFWLGVALLAAGCGGAADDSGESAQASCPTPTAMAPAKPAPVCEAGRAAECPCADGTKSAQECMSDGTGWVACACGDDQNPVSPTTAGSKECSGPASSAQLEKFGGCPAKFPFAGVLCDQAVVSAGICYPFADFFCCSR